MSKRKIGEKKSPELVSRVVSARLNPDYDEDREALKYWDTAINDGFTPRAIITDALVHRAGATPEMFHRSEDGTDAQLHTIKTQLDAIYSMIEGGVIEMLKNIKLADPSGFQAFANSESGEMELSEQFAQNAQKAARKTFRQRGE